jgi:hypothetical protein
MSATLMGVGQSRGSLGASDIRDDTARGGSAGGRGPVPPARPERPKNWLARLIELMRSPVEPNFDNP